VILIFKCKGHIQKCGNYKDIKLMSHTIKIYEKIIDKIIIISKTSVTKNQFGFMPGKSTMKSLFCVM